MSRYRVIEMTPSGYGRRFYAAKLRTVRDIVAAMGGEWWVRREANWGGRWHRDGGRNDWLEPSRDLLESIR